MPATHGEKVPLARLFLSAAGMLVDDLHAELVARGWRDVRHAWGFVLGRLSTGPASVNDLAAFLGVSKQAASKTVEHMLASGLVRISSHPEDGRRKMLEMTDEGRRFLTDVEEIYEQLEESWAGHIGRHELELMRSQLTAFLTARNDGTMPPPTPFR